MSEQLVGALAELIHSLYPGEQPVPLHRPTLDKTDEAAVAACVASTFVSSAGPEIQAFEDAIAGFCGSPYAIATVNGTAALHLALHCCGVKPGDLVLTQSLTFAATGHAILQADAGTDAASSVFVDQAVITLGTFRFKKLRQGLRAHTGIGQADVDVYRARSGLQDCMAGGGKGQ